jgi:hypothetical protein
MDHVLGLGFLFLILFTGVCLFIYFLPAIIAHKRDHKNRTAILVLNIFAGWTAVGWLIALIWSFTNPVSAVIVNQYPPTQSI